MLEEIRKIDCQFGQQYYKDKKQKSTRVCVQGTRKIGCKAHVVTREYILYPEFNVAEDNLSGWKLRKIREEKLKALRNTIASGEAIKTVRKYYISLPTAEAHHQTHQTGGMHGMAQRMHPRVAQKIRELVLDGITEVPTVCQMLRHCVNNDLRKEEKPSCSDRAYYPTKDDIKNHVYRAKKAFELSKFDQHNLELKLKALKDDTSDNSSMYMFRPFKHRAELEELQASDSTEFEQTLLWIHQEKWQQELLQLYGNDICLIDATYKTTKYELPLFFVCVRTNVGYSVIAQFSVQQEGTSEIQEALEVLKRWNPTWKPKHFVSDYSEAEIGAISSAFPATTTCDFHREQSWERWVKDQTHEVSPEDGEKLLELLRACAHAPPATEEGLEVDHHYKSTEALLKDSDIIYKDNPHVKFWLSKTWLNISQVLHVYLIALHDKY